MFNKILTIVFFLTVIATTFIYTNRVEAQTFITEELVSYWPFDRAHIKGKTVYDVVGDNDGSMMGDPKTVEGKVGEALEFDGVDDRVVVKDNPSLNSSTFSIEMWLKPITIRPFEGQWPNIIMGREVYKKSGFRYRITAGGSVRFWS